MGVGEKDLAVQNGVGERFRGDCGVRVPEESGERLSREL